MQVRVLLEEQRKASGLAMEQQLQKHFLPEHQEEPRLSAFAIVQEMSAPSGLGRKSAVGKGRSIATKRSGH